MTQSIIFLKKEENGEVLPEQRDSPHLFNLS